MFNNLNMTDDCSFIIDSLRSQQIFTNSLENSQENKTKKQKQKQKRRNQINK